MDIPRPLPDELALGYLGRIATLNGLQRHHAQDQFTAFVRSRAGSATIDGWIDAVATVSGLPTLAFLKRHTLLPFQTAIRASRSREVSGTHAVKLAHRLGIGRTIQMCPQCVREDEQFWGISYWRRSHQLPGLVACPKHDDLLLQFEIPAYSVLPLPEQAISRATPPAQSVVDQARSSAVIARYVAISLSILERNDPLSVNQVALALRSRLSRQKAEYAIPGVKTRVSDLCRRLLMGPWQRRWFPELTGTKARELVESLDRTTHCGWFALPTKCYALAMALVFQDPDEAMTAVACNSNRLQSRQPVDAALERAFAAFKSGLGLVAAAASHDVDLEALEALLRRRAKSPQATALAAT